MTLTLFGDRKTGAASSNSGVIGRRFLAAVQTFAIGRLTSHVVPLVPARFVAVTGRGPDNDSNGSCKTTFLAAIALLCGDPYWGLAGGGELAAGLLFNPDPAGVSRDQYPPAETGYIVGVFEHPDGTDPMTVWLRLNAGSPIRVRWAPGVHLVGGDTEAARLRAAEEAWASLGQNELKSNFAAHLYGDAPRCLAWLEQRASEVTTKPTLLSANLAGFDPAHIGQELVKLCGRAGAAEEDVDQRRRLDELQRDLTGRRDEDEKARGREDEQLRVITGRSNAAQAVRAATTAWRLHFARGWLDRRSLAAQLSADRDEAARLLDGTSTALHVAREAFRTARDTTGLQGAVDGADQAFTDAEEAAGRAKEVEWSARQMLRGAEQRRNDLMAAADTWDGATVEDAAAASADAEMTAGDAQLTLREARRTLEVASKALADAKAGRAGRGGLLSGRLQDADIDAAVLLDAVVIDDAARDEWESRLALYTDAVVVAPATLSDAVAVAEPGDVIVSSADGQLPSGIVDAPPAASQFLRALAGRYQTHGRTAVDDAGVTIVGGFPAPTTGRGVRVASAEAAVRQAQSELVTAAEAEAAATDALRRAAARLDAAVAAAGLLAAHTAVRAASEALAEARAAAGVARSGVNAAQEVRDEARAALSGAADRAKLALAEVRRLEDEAERQRQKIKSFDDQIERQDMQYWITGWGDEDPDSASAALDGDTRGPLSEDTYRKLATDAVGVVLGQLGFDDPAAAPSVDIAAAVRDRADPSRSSSDPTGRLLAALGAWLADQAEMDGVTSERIDTDRSSREAAIATCTEGCAQASDVLSVVQDAIVRSVRTRLEAVERQLDRLNRAAGKFGAELGIEVIPPARPDERWRWEVAPRWRRAPGARMLDYRTIANSAQAKLFSVHLVVAALFASGEGSGSLLILDELGNSLGAQHRREVLRSLAEVAEAEGITVLGTCQDDLLVKAAEVCGEEIVFERASASDVLNAPVRVWGYDDTRARVEQVAGYHRAGRRLG